MWGNRLCEDVYHEFLWCSIVQWCARRIIVCGTISQSSCWVKVSVRVSSLLMFRCRLSSVPSTETSSWPLAGSKWALV
jgi:hypothetical protein